MEFEDVLLIGIVLLCILFIAALPLIFKLLFWLFYFYCYVVAFAIYHLMRPWVAMGQAMYSALDKIQSDVIRLGILFPLYVGKPIFILFVRIFRCIERFCVVAKDYFEPAPRFRVN